MFLPIKFVHPVRTQRWRWLTLPVALIWTGLAIWAAWLNFEQPQAVTLGLILSSVYLLLAGAVQQVVFREKI
jgi:phosphatidylcholine synthase